mgnify:FL=1
MMLPERDENGKFPAFAWPGGYPLIYLDKDMTVLCAPCASRQAVVAYDVYYEGPPEFCGDCNAVIESAYGDPEADDDKSEGQS